jgi:hypothetical protein
MIREIAEVALEFAMRRILGHLAVHREIRKFGHLLRRDQVRGLVHGRLRTVDVPEAADIGMQFESPVKGMPCSISVLAMASPIGPAPINA